MHDPTAHDDVPRLDAFADLLDVAIVGGGPGGLQAALTLGRARRDVVVIDAGVAAARNARAVHMQNFITRDGTPPAELRRLAHEELARYPTVDRVEARVQTITGEKDAFVLALADGRTIRAKRIFLALGVVDELPPIPGIADIWGTSSAQCPYCHGYEVRDRRLLTYAPTPQLLEHAGMLLGWSSDLVALTNGADFVDDAVREHAKQAGIVLDERKIARVEGVDGQLTQVVFSGDDGKGAGTRAGDFLFTQTAQRQAPVVQALMVSHGLQLDDNGSIVVNDFKATNVDGIFAFGDCTTRMQAAMSAAAGGMMAAAALAMDPAMRGAVPARRRAAARGPAKTSG